MIVFFNFNYCNFHYKNNNFITNRLHFPSIEYRDGEQRWLTNGSYHREDGAAFEWGDRKVYYLDGKHYEEKDYWKIIRFKGYL